MSFYGLDKLLDSTGAKAKMELRWNSGTIGRLCGEDYVGKIMWGKIMWGKIMWEGRIGKIGRIEKMRREGLEAREARSMEINSS
jgi:hypothetical protein